MHYTKNLNGTNLKVNTKDNILKRIFFDENKNWESLIKIHPKNIREIGLEEVEKFRVCGEEANP